MDSLVHVQSSSCFQVISDNSILKNWTDARDACDNEGGRLAVLDTKGKIDTVIDVMRDNTDFPQVGFYLGAHRPMDRWNTAWPNGEQDYIWLNGQPLDPDLTAPYWKDSDPNNWQDGQNVIMLYGDQGISRPWVDDNADRIEGYICEFSLI
ncbi:hypothetical protein V1264_018238 [Littorina saxatilis]|uniref:C-type lectin domain-containing protein n=2 Tax=Littorina saxatilis TaxID=31220 RepID=A0AAN9GDY1_9CAEN